MGPQYKYMEIRFVLERDLTHCYVLVHSTDGDSPVGVQGWHHKAFPYSTTILEIVRSFADGGEEDSDPVVWPMKAPKHDSH